MEQNIENSLLFYVILFPILIFSVIAIFFNNFLPFLKARKYIKMEIKGSDGEEHKYWKRELIMLYIEYIPLIGWFIRRIRR